MNEHFKILNALRRNLPLASELPASFPNLYAWIGVYPLDLSWDDTRELLRNQGINVYDPSKPLYRIRLFEAERQLIDQDVWVCESDLKNKRDFFIQGDKALFAKLAELKIDPDKLEMPSNSNYPI